MKITDQHLCKRGGCTVKCSPSYDRTAVTGEAFTLDLNPPWAAKRIDEDPVAPTPPRVLAGIQVVRQQPMLVERHPRAHAFVVRPTLHKEFRARIRMNFDGLDVTG